MSGNVHVIDHPLVQHKLTLMRRKTTSTANFRRLLSEVAALMAYEVTRDVPMQEVEIETPLETMTARMIDGKKLVFVPILRAGTGLLDGFLSVIPGARVAGAIETAHRNHRVDPVLVLAVIRQESHFKVNARGAGNSIGLMQVRPFVGADVARRHNIPWAGAKTLLDPAANVQIGACYLGEMLEMFHDPALAIVAYNMGPTRVRRMVARGHHPKPAYLGSVLKHFQALSSELGEIPPEAVAEALAE